MPWVESLYVEWVEGPTKTHRGGLTKMGRRLPQKMFATGDERCPVKFLEKHRWGHQASSSLVHSTWDHLRSPREMCGFQRSQWESTKSFPMWRNLTLGDWSAQTSGSPTSVRKTTVHKLQKAGFSNDKIAAITGHRNEQQLRGYAMADMQDHQHISSILSKPCTVPPPVFQRDPSQQQVQLHKLLCVHK